MPTKIVSIDVSDIPAAVEGLGRYDALLILVRAAATPMAKITLPVSGDRIPGIVIETAIRDAVASLAESRVLPFPEHDTMPPDDRPSASVAICTRERPDDLRKCLEALGRLLGGPPEVMVIDNAPVTGSTKTVAGEFDFVRYVVEPRKGLDNARNRALAEASTEIVAFIDDDAVADPHWFEAICRPFRNPRVGCVTGLTMPLELETDGQELFERVTGFSRRGFMRRSFETPETPPLATGRIGAGANMAIRRSILDRTGLFDPALDAGTASCSGGDHEFFTRVLRAGLRIDYDPGAMNWHRHRRTREETLSAIRGYGVGVYAMWTASLLKDGDFGVLRIAFGWFVHEQLPNLLRALFSKNPPVPRDIVLAELAGCLRGPLAYLKARRAARD